MSAAKNMPPTDRPYLDVSHIPLRKAFPSSPPPAPVDTLPAIPTRDADALEVLRCVARSFLVSLDQLISKDRHRSIAEARQVAYWLLRTRTRMSLPEIGRLLRKDHSTVMIGVRRIVRRRATEPSFERFTDELATAVDARLRTSEARNP